MTEAHAPFHVGLTPSRIVDVASELTQSTHLQGWSMRDLAGRLDVAPSVLYHHIGGREAIARAVVERVLSASTPAERGDDWQDWFRAVLLRSRERLAPFPGVAHWLLMHGPSATTVLPTVETGIELLREAGFDDRADLAFATLLNTALLTISMAEERARTTPTPPNAVPSYAPDPIGPELRARMASTIDRVLHPYGDDADADARYFAFVVDTTIAGLARTLPGGDGADA